MTRDALAKAIQLQADIASLKNELACWNSQNVILVECPLTLRMAGSLRHVTKEMFEAFRDTCVKHILKQIQELQTEFESL
jgi:hypothetical protein